MTEDWESEGGSVVEYLLCEECGRSCFNLIAPIPHCAWCGSYRLVLASSPPAVVQFRESR